MSDDLEITYRARDGRLPVDLDIHLAPDGQAEVYVGTTYSIPLERVSRVGTFAGKAPTAEVNAIRDYLVEHDLMARGGSHGQRSPDTPNRYLEIRADGREAQLRLAGMSADAEIDGFERLLQGLALAMTNQPVRAVEASLDLRTIDGQIAATIELQSIGSEAMTALLVDPDQPGMVLSAQVRIEGKMALPSGASMPMALGSTALPPESVQALVQAGDVPSGIAELPPNAVYRFELPPVNAPQVTVPVTATGTLSFWLPEGQARRGMTVLTPETPLPVS